MRKQKSMSGYFSVEAALVLPAVLGVYLFLIVILFIQYDRCLLEQDMASMLIKADNYSGTPRQRLEYLQELTTLWDREQYLWLQPQTPCFTIQGQRIRLETAGEYALPTYGNLAYPGETQRLELAFSLITWDRAALVRRLVRKSDDIHEGESFQRD